MARKGQKVVPAGVCLTPKPSLCPQEAGEGRQETQSPRGPNPGPTAPTWSQVPVSVKPASGGSGGDRGLSHGPCSPPTDAPGPHSLLPPSTLEGKCARREKSREIRNQEGNVNP